MSLTGLEIAAAVAIIGAIPLCLWSLKMTFRLLSACPALGLVASLMLMGWAHQNPEVVPDLVDRATPDFMDQIEAQARASTPPTVIDDSQLTDENLVDQYRQKNVHFAHQVERAPRAATGSLGM